MRGRNLTPLHGLKIFGTYNVNDDWCARHVAETKVCVINDILSSLFIGWRLKLNFGCEAEASLELRWSNSILPSKKTNIPFIGQTTSTFSSFPSQSQCVFHDGIDCAIVATVNGLKKAAERNGLT